MSASSTTRVNDPAAGGSGRSNTHSASSVGGESTSGDKPIDSDGIRKKTTSLWSYILPLNNTNETPSANNNTITTTTTTTEVPLPTTSPSDRNAVSIRLALGDTQASLQHLSDRIDRVLDQRCQEAKKVEQLIGGVVQSVERAFTAVAESNAAHTSKLEEALSRCGRLEEALSAQSKAISDLGAKCDANLSETSRTFHRLGTMHDNVISLLPAIPLLHTLPTEIQNSEFKTAHALEHALDRSAQNQYTLLSAETKSWITEHQSKTSASLDKLREDVRRELDVWSGALSLHRQEMTAIFSAALAGIRNMPGTTASAQSQISMDGASPGRGRGSETPQTAIALNATHTVNNTTHEQPHGPLSSSGFLTAPSRESEKTVAQHAAKNPISSSRHIQASLVHDKNSTQTQVLPGRVLVEDTQSTALSSLPDEDQPEREERVTFAVRGFGALGKRASSTLGSFTNPGSPVFTVHRRPFVQDSTSAQPLRPAPSLTKEHTTQSSLLTSKSEVSGPRRETTLGRSSPSGNHDIPLTSKKRPARAEDAPPGPTKRSRKTKTRVLMDSQELLTLDSSPER
ncbi:hypothetical protein OPQ81_001786 [Rhizoctonia solani]|nr:hypothetical protein OPQ81_001786 [Rhizoctonia solani]